MKKHILSTFAVACTLLSSAVNADNPTSHQINVTCPAVNLVSNFGDYLAGYGSETIFGNLVPIYFKNMVFPAGVPTELTTYSVTDVNYNSTTAQVACSYTSSNASNPSFDLNYYITNGKGGLITAKTATMISLQLPVGFRK